MKRKWMMIVTVITALGLAACGSNKEKVSLYEQGLEVVSLMEEMANSESYIQLFTGNTEINEIIQNIAEGDYSQPAAVYEVIISEDNYQMVLENTDVQTTVSEELERTMQKKINAALVTQINALGGSMNLAASTVCTVGKSFIDQGFKQDRIYIYTYENTVPVAITFLEEEEGIVSATGSFLINEELQKLTEETIALLFEDMNVTVQKVGK